MIDLTNLDEVKALQAHLRVTLETDAGKEVIKYLEELCGWYDFSADNPDKILIAHGKRQVLATIKTLIKLTPEQIVALTKAKE
jgi:hypothetical protein